MNKNYNFIYAGQSKDIVTKLDYDARVKIIVKKN